MCSTAQADRYLLNRMSAEEEDSFQEHLEQCASCSDYLKRVRTLSSLISGEEATAYEEEFEAATQLRRRLKLRTQLSVAAAIALLLSVSLYWLAGEYPGNGLTSHIPFISEMSRARGADADLQVLFPDKDTLTFIISEKPLVLKWNKAVNYKLTLRSNGKMVMQIRAFGDHYSPGREELARHRHLDWTLEGSSFARKEGHILLKK